MKFDDETPRGFVLKADYIKVRQENERLREDLIYAKWRLGENAGDDERCVVAGRRLGLRRGDMKFMLRMVRSSPMPVLTADQLDTTRVYVCRLRAAILKADGDPRLIQTVDGVGYMVAKHGLQWLEGWVPELFRPLADVMGEFQLANFHRDTRGPRDRQQNSGGKQRSSAKR